MALAFLPYHAEKCAQEFPPHQAALNMLSAWTIWLVIANNKHKGIRATIHPALSQLGSCSYQGCV